MGSRYSQPRGVGLRNFEDDILRMKQKYERDAVGPAKQEVLRRAEENEVKHLAGNLTEAESSVQLTLLYLLV